MKKRWKEIGIALLLGMVFPSIMFAQMKRNYENMDSHKQTDAGFATYAVENQDISLSVLMNNGNTEKMQLEAYLVGVVLQEMPAEFELEALKAQAIVARTYALRRLESGGKHETADVCTDPSCCQAYCAPEDYLDGVDQQLLLDKVEQAVFSTTGQVLVYEGQLIEATYFSCSGGMTEDAIAVWGTDIPYLQSTESPGEEGAVHFVDTVTYSVSEFAGCLNLKSDRNPSTWIESVTYTNGGGVETMRICGKAYKGTELRKALGLRSTAFTMSIVGDTVTVTTKGYGHRVGMSQYGAEAMAVQGENHKDILFHYYKGTELVTYSGN